jgi:hypothetical protein
VLSVPFSHNGKLEYNSSVRAIRSGAFNDSGIRSIAIGQGSVSFSVRNKFLLDFDGRSLVWVIGQPESIVIPSSIEKLRPSCCASKTALRIVEFESNSNLRSIGSWAFYLCPSLSTIKFEPGSRLSRIESGAFADCPSLSSVWIPSSIEVMERDCFLKCNCISGLTFESCPNISIIESDLFGPGKSLFSTGILPVLQSALARYCALAHLVI